MSESIQTYVSNNTLSESQQSYVANKRMELDRLTADLNAINELIVKTAKENTIDIATWEFYKQQTQCRINKIKYETLTIEDLFKANAERLLASKREFSDSDTLDKLTERYEYIHDVLYKSGQLNEYYNSQQTIVQNNNTGFRKLIFKEDK